MPMACLDMFNTDHQGLYTPMSPRISFSNGFLDTQQTIKHERSSRSEAPVSSDFEFSVTNNTMITADELFSKGRLLPFKDNCTNQLQKMTLRDELLIDEDDDNVSPRPPKGSIRWKGLLGLKRNHIVSRKADKSDGAMERIVERKRSMLVHEEPHVNKISQELLSDEGSSCRDLDTGI
ncbi:hypothetical protein HHK36_009943 [Tetracentron sinense]|uniref:Uncharacterized protein n=1 Tax=Tetracentron sinense TaxID=13715 RepID=A0A835DIT9_TETSI|nr:hypothetical protein HHK36_009943 [Tetracentron sinense]